MSLIDIGIIKMRYSVEPRHQIYIKGYGFLSFAKNIGRRLSNKYSQTHLDSAKNSATDAIKTASNRIIQKTAEETCHLISNKIADKIKVSKTSQNNLGAVKSEEDIPEERYLSQENRQLIILVN